MKSLKKRGLFLEDDDKSGKDHRKNNQNCNES